MPVNYGGDPRRLSLEETGGVNWGEALKQGLNLNKQFQEARTMPKKLAEELLQAQLKTKHDETINKYLDRSEQARIGATESNTGLDPVRRQLMESQARKANEPAKIAYNNLEKAQQGQKRVIEEYGENSPQADAAQKYVDRIANGTKGQGSGATNATNTAFQTTQTANSAREYIADNVKNPYGGNFSSSSMGYDLLRANLGDKEAKNRLIDAIVYSKTLPENALFQLQSQGAKGTVHAINAQKEALKVGMPVIQDWVNEHVPQSLLNEANEKYNNVIGDIKKIQQGVYEQGFNNKNQPKSFNNKSKKVSEKANQVHQENRNNYDIPEGYIGLFKNGEPKYFPPSLVELKLTQGYSYEP